MSAKTDNNAKDRADADELAVILAKERLVENKPCPVCGSVEHPHPASDRAAAQTELGRAENNADEKRKKNEKAGSLVRLLGTVQQILNSLGIDGVSIGFDCQAGLVRLRVEFQDIALTKGQLDGIALSAGLLYIEGLDLSLPKAEMLKKAEFRVESLVLRVSAGMLNRALECDKVQETIKNLPVDIRDLRFSVSGNLLLISGEVRKGFGFPFSVELKPEAKNNKLRVVFANFWAAGMLPMPDFLRRMLMSVVNQKIGGKESLKGVVSIDDDVITVNPWPKIPVKLNSEIRRFGMEGHSLVLELGAGTAKNEAPQVAKKDAAAAKVRNAAVPAHNPVKPQPVKARVTDVPLTIPDSADDANSEDSGEMIMPFIS